MAEGINVVSLFNGMGCAWLAFDKAGIKINKRFSSEIDKYSNIANNTNYPDTIQLGDVRNITKESFGGHPIDILVGGSPCQSFSFAGKRKGMSTKCEVEILSLKHYLQLKEQNFEFEGQSYLFWEYMRIKNEVNPKYFLLENVEMGAKWEKVLSMAIGVRGLHINSALVSAQNRKRIYWNNFSEYAFGLFGEMKTNIPQPKDKGILLKDILEKEVDQKYYISETALNRIFRKEYSDAKFNPEKTGTLNTKNNSGQLSVDSGTTLIISKDGELKSNQSKASCFTAGGNSGGNHSDMDLIATGIIKSGTLRTHNDGNGFREVISGKGATIPARAREDVSGQNVASINGFIRRLTPIECCRLQTVPDDYFFKDGKYIISETQVYKCLGNGWTVDVIAYLLSFINC